MVKLVIFLTVNFNLLSAINKLIIINKNNCYHHYHRNIITLNWNSFAKVPWDKMDGLFKGLCKQSIRIKN